MTNTYTLNVNGKSVRVEADGEQSLLDTLRNDLDLTGTKYGCGEGQCGACTVLLDKDAVKSCMMQLDSVGSKAITTIEGLDRGGTLHAVQEAFLETDALQCGYCTSGMIMSALSLLNRNASPSEPDIIRAMNTNICRCCCYSRILRAVDLAARKMRRVR